MEKIPLLFLLAVAIFVAYAPALRMALIPRWKRRRTMAAILDSKETGKLTPTRFHLASRTGAIQLGDRKRHIKVPAEAGTLDAAIEELRHCLTTQWYRADSWLLLAGLEEKRDNEAEAENALPRAHELDVHLGEDASAL